MEALEQPTVQGLNDTQGADWKFSPIGHPGAPVWRTHENDTYFEGSVCALLHTQAVGGKTLPRTVVIMKRKNEDKKDK